MSKALAKRIILALAPVIDLLFAPLVALAGCMFAGMRRTGVEHFRLSRRILAAVGVFPVRDHYYEPLVNPKHLHRDLSEERELPGLCLNESGQLEFLKKLCYRGELNELMGRDGSGAGFSLGNQAFESGDAEYWYSLVRAVKPGRIIEIGSGNSTLIAIAAIRKNREEQPGYACRHICIEPYEAPWLERAGPEIMRSRVELLPTSFFSQLEANDILFVDSSHVILPQGDVLFECLQVFPSLRSKVIVHVHDIFTPRDYPEDWIRNRVRLWNEQYLLEAFLTENREWKVLGALNFLHHHHYDELARICPFLTKDREPGSFYIQRT
jgi:hypothetical protein